MQRSRKSIHIVWIGIAVLSLVFFILPQQGMAVTWGYPSGSCEAQCLATARAEYNIFPDHDTAEAAWNADITATQAACYAEGNPESVCEWIYGLVWTCPGSAGCNGGCTECYTTCESHIPDSGFSCSNCLGEPLVNKTGFVPETNYWYPLAGCSSTLLPTQIPDPTITTVVTDKNLGSGGGGTCSRLGDKFVCNPVNVTTGNKYEPVLDLALSQPGVPFEFRRYYNNTQAADGPLGFGWTHSYSMSPPQSLTTWTLGGIPTPIRVKIIDADGRALYFTMIFQTYPDGYDHYYGESGVRDRLLWNPLTGYFFLRKKDSNLTYEFATPNGTLMMLSSIYDTNGNTLTLAYNTSHLLTQVANNFNKTLTIAYNSSNRISSVTDPNGQQISYTYDANGNLTKVTYPDSNSVSYFYSNDTYHNLTDKKDTNSNVIGHWDYDSNNRVTAYYKYLNGTQQQEWASIIYGISVPTVTTLNHQTGTTTYTTAINDGIGTVTNTDACGSTCCGSNCSEDVDTSYAYDSRVNLTDVSIPGQTYTTHYTYDNPTNFYDLVGEVRSVTEANGITGVQRTTNYAYTHNPNDPFGLLLNSSTETKPSVVNPSSNSNAHHNRLRRLGQCHLPDRNLAMW